MTRPPLAHAAVLAAALALAGCAADPVVSPTALPEGAPSGSLQGTQDVEAAAGGAAAKRGTITVSLLMRPEGPADVAFTTDSRSLRPFTLDDDADPALDNAVTFRNVKPGAYAIQMASAPDGPLTAIRCTSTGGTDNNAVDVATRTATLNVEAGESVACTFIDAWESGDLLTYSQSDWGDAARPAGALLVTTFNQLYPGALAVGDGYQLLFSDAVTVQSYLPASGVGSALTASHRDPLSTESGALGGEVVALRLNVDFVAHGFLPSAPPLGSLRICDFSDAPTLNGQSVTQLLATAEAILGGSATTLSGALAAGASRLVNTSMSATPTEFAQASLFPGACP